MAEAFLLGGRVRFRCHESRPPLCTRHRHAARGTWPRPCRPVLFYRQWEFRTPPWAAGSGFRWTWSGCQLEALRRPEDLRGSFGSSGGSSTEQSVPLESWLLGSARREGPRSDPKQRLCARTSPPSQPAFSRRRVEVARHCPRAPKPCVPGAWVPWGWGWGSSERSTRNWDVTPPLDPRLQRPLAPPWPASEWCWPFGARGWRRADLEWGAGRGVVTRVHQKPMR